MTRHDALRLIARALAGDAPRAAWDETAGAWPVLLEVATQQRVAGALCGALEAAQVLATLPEEFRETLEILRTLSRERNAIVLAQAREAMACLEHAEIEAVLLKGVGNLARGLYPDTADRLVGDLDVLVQEDALLAAVAALEEGGYFVHAPELLHADGASRIDIHYAPLAHATWPLVIELHWKVLQDAAAPGLETAELLARTEIVGGQRVLSCEDALVYNVLHAEERHGQFFSGRAQVWQLLDTLLLARKLDPAARPSVKRRAGRVWAHHAGTLCVFFGAELVPEGLREALGRAARWRLRQQVNGSAAGWLDAAACTAVQAMGTEWDNLRRQWEDPAQRAALRRKLARPGSYLRRVRNLVQRVGGRGATE